MATKARVPGLQPIMMGLVAWPLLMRGLHKTCGLFHDIPYKDADCMLKLINDTNKAHYDAHPLWPYLSYESDCDSVAYARAQATENQHEAKLLGMFALGEVFVGSAALFRGGLSVEALLFGWVAGMNTQYTMHYQHDLTQFVGNLVHHGGEGVLAETGSGGAAHETEKGKSVPHGQAPSFVANELMIAAVAYVAHGVVAPVAPFASYFGCRAFVSLIKMRFQTLLVHPFVHAEGGSIFPWPLSKIIEDYDCHIVNHHRDGTCLGVIDFLPLNRGYDALMHFQASFYRSGAVKRRTPAHWALTFGMEYVLVAATFATFAGYMALAKAVKGGGLAKSLKAE